MSDAEEIDSDWTFGAALAVLGFDAAPTPAVLKKQWVSLNRLWHPDRNKETGKVEECLKMTQDINSAYHFLTVVGYSKN